MIDIAHELYTQMDYVGHDILCSPFEAIHDKTMSRVACHHRLWTLHTVGQHRAWKARVSLGQHTWLDDVERGTLSSPVDCTGSRMTSGVSCHHSPWKTLMVRRNRVWLDIMALGPNARLDDVGRDMPSSPLYFKHTNDVGQGIPS